MKHPHTSSYLEAISHFSQHQLPLQIA